MSVVGTAKRLSKDDGADLSFEKDTYSLFYRVDTNDKSDGAIIVCLAPGLPQIGSYYDTGNEANIYAICKSYKPKRIAEGHTTWEVEVLYETLDPTEPPTPAEPLLAMPEASLGSEGTQVIAWGTFNGSGFTPSGGVKTAAGEPLDPPLLRDMNNPVLTITRNEAITTNVMATKFNYECRVNTDTFWGWSAGYAMIRGIDATITFAKLPDGSFFPYLRVSYQIVFNVEGWQPKVVEQGTYYLEGGKKVAFKTDDGTPCLDFLDTNGTKLSPNATPIWTEKKIYPQTSFASLGLPQSFLAVAWS